jgi:hypothetical protein
MVQRSLFWAAAVDLLSKVDQHKIAMCALVQPIVESVELFAVNQL